MKRIALFGRRALAVALSAGMLVSMMPGNISLAAEVQADAPVYAAAYQDAQDVEDTTLPQSVSVNGQETKVEWSWRTDALSVPYSTVQVSGNTESGDTVKAQVEVIPQREHELVYFVDASRDAGKESVAFESVKALAGDTLINTAADQTYTDTSKWGRSGSNFTEKNTNNVDVTKKIQTGWYSSSRTASLNYKYELEPGTYTLTAGFYEWWNGRSMKLVLSGDGMESVASETATVSGIGSSDVVSVNFEVDSTTTVNMEVQNATGGEAPVISWFAVAKGEVSIPDAPIWEEDVIVNGDDVDVAAQNVNGLTYKGFALLSGNSTSNLLIDYKDQNPDAYNEMLEVLFGGEHPLMTHVKMEMGNDGNNSTGADSCTMRFEDEEADVSRSPGFQLAADAKKINPNVKVSFLRWTMPSWVQSAWNSDRTGAGYEAMYKWYRETVFDAYEKYGYVVDYINPDTNETSNPDGDFIKWFRKRVSGETEFPSYMDAAAQEAYHNIKIIASDENTSLNIVPKMRSDEELYDAVDAIGFHYRAGDAASTEDYRRMADEDDKEVWYSEGCATFSYTEYQENKNTEYGSGTIGGYQSPLALADNFIKSFVYSRKTHYIFQPAIGSFYEGAQYDHKEIMSAREPWAGYVHYDPVMYMLEHFSKFAVTGWENSDNTAGIWRVIANASDNNSTGSDHLRNEAGNPSYMTLAAPDKSNFSVVMVNNSEKTVNYRVKPENMNLADNAAMEIWETKTDSYLQYRGEAETEDGYYLVTVEPYSMVTLTTLDCDGEEEYTQRLPEEREKSVLDTDENGKKLDSGNRILYADDFEYDEEAEGYLENRGNEPRYVVDFSGAFVVEDGQMKQVLNQSVSQWNNNGPNAVVGDFRWANYKASVDVTVPDSGYAGINIRQQTGMNFEGSGYNLQITKDGSWTLKKRGTTLQSGKVGTNSAGTYRLSLEGKGAIITAWIDGKEVASYVDENPEYFGRVRFGCSWKETSFDNLVVEKVDGYIPYATSLIDNAADEVAYTGAWTIIAGGGGSNNDWYRSTSTATTAGASFTFPVQGDGFALIGANDGTAVLDVEVDGSLVDADARGKSSNQHCVTYMLTGLGEADHEVKVTLKSGTMVLDAIQSLPYSETDKTALEDMITKAEAISHDPDYEEGTWNALVDALSAAKDVAADEDALQTEIDDAYGTLKKAVEGLSYTYSVVEVQKVSGAIDLSGENTLPGRLTCTTAAGDQVEKEVDWNLEEVSLKAYDRITVYGTIRDDGFQVEAELEVVPEDLVYFIDSGMGGVTQSEELLPYDAVKALVPELKNDKADQPYAGAGSWGYTESNVSVRDLNSVTYTDKATSGLWALGNGSTAKPIIYTLPLEQGEYNLTAGFQEWWSGPRTMNITASWTDETGQEKSVLLAENIQISSSDRNKQASGEFTLDVDTDVTITISMPSGTEAPVISWLALNELNAEANKLERAKNQLNKAVEDAKQIKSEEYTPESYTAVEKAIQEAESILDNESATLSELEAAMETLNDAVSNLERIIVDKDDLKTAIVAAKELDESSYTEESYAAVEAAIREAERVVADESATQDDVEAAKEALKDAISKLEKAPVIIEVDKEALRAAIASAKALDGSSYTAESYAAVTTALRTAQAVLANVAATQENVDAAREALQKAIANLKKAETPAPTPNPTETKMQLAAPAVKSVKSVAAKTGSQVKITICKVANADTYTVYRKVGKKVTRIAATSGTSVQDKSPVSGKKASYYAVATSKNAQYTSSEAGKAKTITLAKNTSKVSVKKSGKYVTVKFSKVAGARGYLVYRSTKKNGTYTKLTKKPIKKLTYTDKKAKAKKTYYYKVVTYGKNKTYSAGKVSKKIKR